MPRICRDEKCNKQANYNFVNEKIGLYCKTHKMDNMYNIMCLSDCLALISILFKKHFIFFLFGCDFEKLKKKVYYSN